MAQINVHYTLNSKLPTVRVSQTDYSCNLVIDVLGGDNITLFFENEDALCDFVNSVQTALTACLQDDSNIPDPINGVDDSVRLDG